MTSNGQQTLLNFSSPRGIDGAAEGSGVAASTVPWHQPNAADPPRAASTRRRSRSVTLPPRGRGLERTGAQRHDARSFDIGSARHSSDYSLASRPAPVWARAWEPWVW